jgi:predicted SprT family Zn-dependent metalloprotease
MEITKDKELRANYTSLVQDRFNLLITELMQSNDLEAFDKNTYKEMTDTKFINNLESNSKLKELLNNISISYDENLRCNGYASLKENKIVVNSRNIKKVNALLIHEFSHLAIYHFSNGKITGHTLEFAIFNYCLDNRINCNVDTIILEDEQESLHNDNKTFFRSYDIHEDPAYSILMINPCQFDTMIKNISFSTLQDLYNKAVKLSNKIRKKTFAL